MRMLNKTSLKFISGFVLIIAVAVFFVLLTGVYEAETNGSVDISQKAISTE